MTKEEKIKAITELQGFLKNQERPMGICIAMLNDMWYDRFLTLFKEIKDALPPRRYENPENILGICTYSFPLTEEGMKPRIQWLEDFKTKVQDDNA